MTQSVFLTHSPASSREQPEHLLEHLLARELDELQRRDVERDAVLVAARVGLVLLRPLLVELDALPLDLILLVELR